MPKSAPTVVTAFSASTSFCPIGKLLRVTGYDTDQRSYAFTIGVQFWDNDSAASREVLYTFVNIPNGKWVDVSHLSPQFNSTAASPTAVGDYGVNITPLAGATVRYEYVNFTGG